MKPIRLYLDEAITRGIVKNDADIARRLDVARATVSRWRAGEKAPEDDQAIALAQMLGKAEGEVLAECAAARAKSAGARMAWERVAKMASMTAASAMLAVVTFVVSPSPANASTGADSRASSLYYVKYRIRRIFAGWRRFYRFYAV